MWRYFEMYAGYQLRFTSFAKEPALYEPIFAYQADVYVYNTEAARIGIGLANFDHFAGNNLGSYFFRLSSRIRLNRRVFVGNELTVAVSGNTRRIVNVYGISARTGVIVSW
jgi:hypothetical protein